MNARADIPLGLFYNVPIEGYHASPGISNSGLGDFARSPFHFHALHVNPDRPPEASKAGQLEGNLAHCAILEPGEFDRRYIVGPSVNRNTKIWHSFVDALPDGCTPIQAEQAMVARAQAMSVRALPDVAKLLGAGQPEVSAFWIDPATGELCRCRPDWVHPVEGRGVILVDVKTYSDASPREFSRQVARKGYHRQAAWYSDGYELASGEQVLGFVFVAVEDKWPFAACALMLDDESIAKGRTDNRAQLDRYAACRKADEWPSYSQSVELISLPAWALTTTTTTEESSP